MTDTNGHHLLTADEIVKDILLSDEPENLRDGLREMIEAFFMYYDAPNEDFKAHVYFTYRVLYNALTEMIPLNPRSQCQTIN